MKSESTYMPQGITFDVTNNGDVAGKEVAQVYIVPPNADDTSMPAKQLKGFAKKEIPAGATVSYSIDIPMEDVCFYDENGDFVIYEGEYTVQVGGDSQKAEEFTAKLNLNGELTQKLHAVTLEPSGHVLDVAKPEKTLQAKLTASMNDEELHVLSENVSEGFEVEYTSTNPGIVDVDENGVITPLAAGITTIKATVTYDGVTMEDSYPVLVKASVLAKEIQVDGIPLEGFDPKVHEYQIKVDRADELPEITVTADETLTVKISNGNAKTTIDVTDGNTTTTYTIWYVLPLSSFDFTKITEEELQERWQIVRENDTNWTLSEDGLTITTERGDLSKKLKEPLIKSALP